MRLLLDSNIVIDYLARRAPFCESATRLMLLGKTGDHELWVSTTQANDIFYVLGEGKKSNASRVKEAMDKLKTFLRFCGLDEDGFLRALDSTWGDLEDACVHEVAMRLSADAIITRNKKDFRQSMVPVYDCGEFLRLTGADGDFPLQAGKGRREGGTNL